MQINRADMKLLTECGYSGLLRNIDATLTPIFEALDTWMPDQAAGPIGLALEAMVAGDFRDADEKLSAIVDSDRIGRDEARAMLAMCKQLQKDTIAAESLASDLEGQGGSAEAFASLLTGKEQPQTQPHDQGAVKMAAG
jgi:thioredoxin-like negative regulator of GroEL